ncbi:MULTISPECIES: hypothetical protein [Mobiluncus]|uniref:hypothetical protein n=1 Tax=Mobiluncus TaxID=2050 RepID=UPI000DFE2EBF|nr:MULTISPECIES: hypothetical protein [Mobiluncus]STY80869.1 Uncharacterised protein [Mobiluncus curtisii subsp. curtisii]STY98439.1 Uncharacterised protein [Mobiluncus holmesii]
MNLKKKFVIGAASLALVAGMGVAPAMAAPADISANRWAVRIVTIPLFRLP